MTDIVDCAIKVHKALGPGLLESAYQHCHAYGLCKRGWDAGIHSANPRSTIANLYEVERMQNWLSSRLKCDIDETRHKTLRT